MTKSGFKKMNMKLIHYYIQIEDLKRLCRMALTIFIEVVLKLVAYINFFSIK